MALNFDLALYLVILGLVDRVFIAPAAVCADRLDYAGSFERTRENRRDRERDTAAYPEAQPYLSLRLDDVKISEYREDEIDKSYVENRQIKRESDGNGMRSATSIESSQSVPERIYGGEVGSSTAGNGKDNGIAKPFLSVPFETVVTITRDNVPQAARTSFEESRNPIGESSPCLEKDHSRSGKLNAQKKSRDTPLKRRITGIANFLHVLRKTVRKRENMKFEAKETESKNSEHAKPDEEYTEFAETPITLFEDESPQQEKNETSQRQELDDDEEESQGSLGSIEDLLPVILPILEDLSNPNSPTDLAALLEATVPLVTDLISGGNDDPNAPDILNTIITAVTTVLAGADGQGLDFAELAGPLLEIAGPFLTPVIGPIVTYALRILTNPNALIGIVTSLLGAVTQPGPDGTSPLLNAVTDFAASVIKDLRPGAPGGLDVGAIIEAVTTGAIRAIKEASLGPFGADKPYGPYGGYPTYGPYGPGPVQAASVNSLQSIPTVILPDAESNEQTDHHNPITAPANTVQHRAVRVRTTRRPQIKLPQRTTPRPPFSLPNFLQQYGADPVQALPANGHGGSSYGPYGNNGVPASSVNPLGLIISSIQNVTGDGIQLVASLINAVFGISGASSADSGPPTQYGPPPGYGPPPPYGNYRPQGAYKKPS